MPVITEGPTKAGGRSGRWSRDAVILFASLTVANVSNYVFHLVMTRLLGVVEYGALGALLAAVLVLSVPTGAIQAVVARRAAAASPSTLAGLLRGSLRSTLVGGILLAAVVASLSAPLRAFFHVDSAVPVVLLAAFLIPATVGPVGRGVLQGRMRFTLLGASLIITTILKLALGIAFVQAGWGISGALAAIVIAEAAGVVVALLPSLPLLAERATAFAGTAIVRETGRVMAAFLGFWLLISVDLLLMRFFHPTEVAGRYAAATLLGRVVFFLPAAVAMAVFPRFAQEPSSAVARGLLARSMAITVALGTAAAGGIILLPGLVQRLFGAEYAGEGAVGGILAMAMVGFGVVNLLLHYRIAEKHPPIKTLFVALAMLVVGIVVAHQSPTAVASIVLGVGLVLVGTMTYQAFRPPRRVDLGAFELGQPTPELDLSVITPSFNGADHVAASLTDLSAALGRTDLRHEIILVSDGSTDDTPAVANGSGVEELRVIHYETNAGKGHALRTGLARARGRYVAFIDSDGDLDPEELRHFISLMDMYTPDLVVGSKRHALSNVQYPFVRRVMSWTYHKLIRVLFGLKVGDTQTGIKLVRRDVLSVVLPRLVEKRFAFDLELLVAARRLGYTRVMEAPVTLDYKFTSTVSARAVRGIVLDTMAIWYRRYVLHWYDDASSSVAPAAPAEPVPHPVQD